MYTTELKHNFQFNEQFFSTSMNETGENKFMVINCQAYTKLVFNHDI